MHRPWHLALVPALALGLLLPKASRSAEILPPAIDLEHILYEDGTLRAPIKSGGRALLTLDPELQQSAERLLGHARPRAGAVVAIEARTGRLLVWSELSEKRRAPSLLSTAREPAASVLKVVTSAALLERSHVSPSQRVCISGGLHGIERRHLDPPRDAGVLCSEFGLALGHSRNAVYAQLVTRYLMRQDLIDVAGRFGFNARLPFDADATMGTLQVPYNDLEFARAATGFRGSKLSALGAAYLAYVVANGGRAAELHIVRSAGDYHVPERKQFLGKVIEPATAHTLTRMMEVTVNSGTSLDAFTDESGKNYLPGIRVAGKTGTLARAVRNERSRSPEIDTTSWFIGFAPSRNPEIVLSVLLVNGPVWRRKAKGIARDLLRSYFAAHGHSNVSDPSLDESSYRTVSQSETSPD